MRVIVKRLQKPRIFRSYELARLCVRPELHIPSQLAPILPPTTFLPEFPRVRVSTHLILIILMHIDTALLRLPPPLRHRIINISLVYNLGNQLRAIVDQGGVWSGYFSGVDSVCGAVFDEKGQKSEDGAD